MLRRFLLLAGLLFAAAGFAVTVEPGVAAVLGLPPTPTTAVAGLAAVFALTRGIDRHHTAFRTADEARNETLEPRIEAPRPGADIDARRHERADRRDAGAGGPQFSARLRTVTVRALADAHGIAPAEAERRLDEGTWTDDRTAAAFFAEDVDPPAPAVITTVVSADPARERQARHVVAELQRLTGIEGGAH
ncbi:MULTISPECIES: DUF7269 family protein [Halobacterium]|uniref:DUF7269 family protein n=1 Tax=Halobacterium TaxID=2239 RepID=UPI001962FBC4|nr:MULTISPECIES: hypothetical protein [Halobacterium]MCF2166125.1 hypothetical protein [Halobacterium salinarum]MCF2166781.1 hypothetical protein [Halobacterium salinarum]QRY22878.1 hypothetical protein JT689_02300 [Halobacterium sp. GSL-19]WJK64175.1 hypothetical protein QSJ49_03255 [Halobacterium salinarum]